MSPNRIPKQDDQKKVSDKSAATPKPSPPSAAQAKPFWSKDI